MGSREAVIEAVTFDFWNTLVHEERGEMRGRRQEAWMGILEDAGFAVERQRLDAAFDSSWQRFLEAWRGNTRHYTATEAAVEIIEELGFDLPTGVHESLVVAFSSAGEDADLHLTGNIEACLRTLRGAGVRVGIICDVGMTPSTTLRRHLERFGVLGLFDHWSFSDEVGMYKPDPRIFEHALDGVGGIAPDRAAHVGDLRRTDIAGALSMGMTAVRYTGVFDDDSQPEPEGHHVLADHAELPKALGVVA